MSVANQKGGYFRTIEINRDTVANSVTTLLEPILKQAGNYIAQVQRFVTNITPQINTFTTPLISILAKPDPTNVGTIDDLDEARAAYNIALAPPVYFSPTNVHSVTELARQLSVFCERHGGLRFTLNPDFTFQITMNRAFGNSGYIKIDPVYAKLLGLDEYLFYFRARVPRDPDNPNAGDSVLVTENTQLWLSISELAEDEGVEVHTENFHFRPALAFTADDPDEYSFTSSKTLFNCDTRQFLDVTFSMPHIAQITILNGVEQHKKILARFPLKDFLETEHINFNDYDTYGARETINLGLEDLTRGNPNVHTMLLLPGDVAHANVQIETTYLQWDTPTSKYTFVTTPTDFGTHGFWSLKLILAKKVK